jgi:hypothetical protein
MFEPSLLLECSNNNHGAPTSFGEQDLRGGTMNQLQMALGFLLMPIAALAQSSKSPQFINPTELSKPPGYTHAVVVSGNALVYLSGQVAFNPHGDLVGKDDFRAQVTQVFENIQVGAGRRGNLSNTHH